MKIALVDDRPEEISRLSEIINTTLPDAHLSTFQTSKEFLDTWKSGEYDLLLLDIFIDETIGIDIARQVRLTDRDARIVFCTTSNEFACESYEVGANYYLQKPITQAGFSRMLEMIRLKEYEASRFIRLPDGQRIVLRNVVSSEYHNHIIRIHMKHGDSIQTRLSQTEWEGILAPYSYFYSCSKGIVINFHEVTKQGDNMFYMSNEEQIPISRRKVKDALAAYAAFRFEQLRKENYL